MVLIEYIWDNEKRFGSKVALRTDQRTLTYSELKDETLRMVAVFSSIGITKGTHAALILQNCWQFVVIMLAAAETGATIVPMNPTLPLEAVERVFVSTDCSYVIGWHGVLAELLGDVEEVGLKARKIHWLSVGGAVEKADDLDRLCYESNPRANVGECQASLDQPFILTMTSGSTGSPKLIVLSQRTKLNRAMAAREMYCLGPQDVILVGSPMYHSLAQRLVLLPLLIGGTAVIPTRFTPNLWLDFVERYRVTFTISVSSQLALILEAQLHKKANLKSLNAVVSSSSPLAEDVKRRMIADFSCDFHECYGASEVGTATNLTTNDALQYPSSVGRAAPGVDIKIVNDRLQSVQKGMVGEILVKTDKAFLGYYKNSNATLQAMSGNYFRTGDLGYMNEAGFIFYVGRKKELIITGGINVYPRDIEELLESHPEVNECAVIGVEDSRLGEAVMAVVALADGAKLTERHLRKYCVTRLADFQQPIFYEFVPELPRNEMGKIMKPVLKEIYSGKTDNNKIDNILR